MLKRLYIDNYRSFVNFEMKTDTDSSLLFIGENGSGKTSVLRVLSFLQRIASGDNELKSDREPEKGGKKLSSEDFGLLGKDAPMTFQIEARINDLYFTYLLKLDYPKGFFRPRVLTETLNVSSTVSYTRDLANISMPKNGYNTEFSLNWHTVALSAIQTNDPNDPICIFREWMKKMILTAPCPQKMEHEAVVHEGDRLELDASNFVSWLSQILSKKPQTYSFIERYIKEIIPDFDAVDFNVSGQDTKVLILKFRTGDRTLPVPWDQLSEGEKCLFLSSVVYAVTRVQSGVFCFWDEPDSYISDSLLNQFIAKLRSSFENCRGQFLVVSHNLEIIGGFNDENTYVFRRNSHTDGTLPLKTVGELRKQRAITGSLANAVLSGDIFDVE